jgi:hypothetical protein
MGLETFEFRAKLVVIQPGTLANPPIRKTHDAGCIGVPMKSPFPGMDPYLEQLHLGGDFHASMTAFVRSDIGRRLSSRYLARIQEYVWTPVNHRLTEKTRYIDIRNLDAQRTTTTVEFLSPTHKHPGLHRDTYLMRRSECLATGVNVVEIDLLRAGERLLPSDSMTVEFDYCVVVRVPAEGPVARIWPWTVRDPFSVIPIPLAKQADILMELRPCFDRAYAEGQYHMDIDYSSHPKTPLNPADQAWAVELLRKHRLN